MPPTATLVVPAEVIDAVLAHTAREVPLEACGLLVGRGCQVARAFATPNAAASPVRYEIQPDAHFAVIREARRAGLEVIGAYHSHPASPAVPSPTDREGAFPDFVFLIAALTPSPHVRGWRLLDGNFTEVSLVRTGGAEGPSSPAASEDA